MGGKSAPGKRCLRDGRIALRARRIGRAETRRRTLPARCGVSAEDATSGWLVAREKPGGEIPALLPKRIPIRSRSMDLSFGYGHGGDGAGEYRDERRAAGGKVAPSRAGEGVGRG